MVMVQNTPLPHGLLTNAVPVITSCRIPGVSKAFFHPLPEREFP